MPTEPFKQILDRDLSKVLAKETIELAVPVLRELVNDGTWVFIRCLDSVKGNIDKDIPVLFSYLHIIEMTDGIESLVKEACASPIIPCLRSSFEAMLALEYILQADSDRRAMAYMVSYTHRRQGMHELFDSDTQRGSDFLSDWEADEAREKMEINLTDFKNVAKKSIANLDNLLKKPHYIEAEHEYQRIKRVLHRKPEWYHLFGGPSNLRELAKHLNYRARYDFLYRSWSNVAHAGDVSRFITETKNGKGAVKALRNVDELASIIGFAEWIILSAKVLVLKKFHPGEEKSIRTWYIKEIQKGFLGLYGDKV